MTGGIESFKPSFMRISNPYLTPRDSPFPTPVPIFVQLGGGEVLYDVGAKFVENMKKVQGNKVELYESQHAPHASLLCGEILGFQKEAIAAANATERFTKAQGVSASS
jgi:acetyl esterase/lipase